MIRKIGFAAMAALALSACATAEPVPVRGATGGTCNDAGLDRYVGQAATAELGAQMQRESGAGIFRWLQPGQIVTMEFNPSRLSVRLDASNRVETAKCG